MLPLVPVDRLTVSVVLPVEVTTGTIAASLSPAGPAEWGDPLRRTAVFPLTLRLTLRRVSGPDWTGGLTLALRPGAHCRIVAGKDAVALRGPDTVAVPVSLEVEAAAARTDQGRERYGVSLAVTAADVPPGLRCEPATLALAETLDAPPRRKTTLTAHARLAKAARWHDPVQGVAEVEADLHVEVAGPLASDTPVILQCPGAVREARLDPPRLSAGANTVRLRVLVECRPAPTRQGLTFTLVPPAAQGAIDVVPPPPFPLEIPGPQPPQMVLRQVGGGGLRLQGGGYDPQTPTTLRVWAELAGDGGSGKPALAPALRAGPTLDIDAPKRLALGQPFSIRIRPAGGPPFSFWSDTVREGELTVAPDRLCPAILGSRQTVMLHYEAPFKRLLLLLTIVIGVALVLWGLWRVWWTLPAQASRTRG